MAWVCFLDLLMFCLGKHCLWKGKKASSKFTRSLRTLLICCAEAVSSLIQELQGFILVNDSPPVRSSLQVDADPSLKIQTCFAAIKLLEN